MTATAALRHSSVRRLPAVALAALRDLRWSQLGIALLLGVALEAWSKTVYLRWLVAITPTMPLGWVVLGDLISSELMAVALLVALVIADRAVDEGASRRRAYVLATLAACLIAAAFKTPFEWLWDTRVVAHPWPSDSPQLQYPARLFYLPILSVTHSLLIGGAFVFLYADRRAARKTAQLLRDAELDRIRRSRLALESQLQAMQARVEPQFLFDTLRHVEKLYTQDAALAARVLDDLIAYLRAAMPVMRESSSSLAQELELVRAYLDIACVRVGGRLSATVEEASAAEHVPMPPMLLLPLVADAVDRRMASASEAAIDVASEVREGRLRLTVSDRGCGLLAREPGVARACVRERLHALYGAEATLTAGSGDDWATRVVLELPLHAGDVSPPR